MLFESYDTFSNQQISDVEKVKALLKSRFKMIAAYPYADNKVGSIISPVSRMKIDHYKDFPHLFRELKWYEERKAEEMPVYVKLQQPYDTIQPGVYKLLQFNPTSFIIQVDVNSLIKILPLYDAVVVPATETEFKNYSNK